MTSQYQKLSRLAKHMGTSVEHEIVCEIMHRRRQWHKSFSIVSKTEDSGWVFFQKVYHRYYVTWSNMTQNFSRSIFPSETITSIEYFERKLSGDHRVG